MTKNNNEVNGILLLDKAKGISSNKILQKVKALFNAKKAGHCGTLDPLATGLLPICFGAATKTVPYLINSSKTYNVTAKLGEKTTTGDSEGEVIEHVQNQKNYTIQEIKTVLDAFIGEINQTPPMYSAVKVNGTPLYKIARKGKSVLRKTRTINIHKILINSLEKNMINLSIHCSKGTYIRTLIEDIAIQLKTHGHVKELRRLSIDAFGTQEMISIEQLLDCDDDKLTHFLKPIDFGLKHLPSLVINKEDSIRFCQGQEIKYSNLGLNKKTIRIYNSKRILIGLATQQIRDYIKPVKVFVNN